MKTDQVQRLNYCVHAIEDMREQEAELRNIAPESAGVLRRLIDLLQASVKFILPNCCNLVQPDELSQAHMDLVRLPFPCVAFESPWVKEVEGPEYVGGFQQSPATKRIALCWEARPEYELIPGMNSYLDFFPQGGVFIVPIIWGQPALERGEHASPRMHLRRGHLRQLDKKTVWVRPAMINAESTRGMVLKDYGVQPKA